MIIRPTRFTRTDPHFPYRTLFRSAYKSLDQDYDVLAEEEHTLHNIPLVLPDEIKPLVGAFLKLTPRGEMVLDTEYYSEEPVRVGGSGDDGEDHHGDDASGDGSAGSGSSHPPPAAPPPATAPGRQPPRARPERTTSDSA